MKQTLKQRSLDHESSRLKVGIDNVPQFQTQEIFANMQKYGKSDAFHFLKSLDQGRAQDRQQKAEQGDNPAAENKEENLVSA